jgi:hypothetical protein
MADQFLNSSTGSIWDLSSMDVLSDHGIKTTKKNATDNTDKSILLDASVVVEGDLIVTGNIYKGIRIPLKFDDVRRCSDYFSNVLKLTLGRDFFTKDNGIIVRSRDYERFRQHIVEALL